MRRQLLGLGFVAASSLVALNAAHAMSGPEAIEFDGGPFGSLNVSGGFDGYGYYVSDTPDGYKTNGANIGSALIELQKSTGILQFTIEVGSNGGAIALGTNTPGQTSVNVFSTGPLYAGYVTIAPPDLPITISAGQIGSVEGYEAGVDWYNAVQFTTDIWYVQNSQSRGVEATYSQGPLSATLIFGDGFDTGVWNFMQALVSYSFDDNNILNVYGATNLGRTGLNTYTYGNSTTGSYGANFVNSRMIGAYYSYTAGNLNLVPEIQYVVAPVDHKLGLDKASSNFGMAVFSDYTFGKSPYSLGAWVEYENSNGNDFWFVGPGSQAIGAAVAPTWQYKYLFARANAGALYLLNNKRFSTESYGNDGRGKFQFLGTLEAGVLF